MLTKELNSETSLKDSIKLLIQAGIEELVSISKKQGGLRDPDIVHDLRVSARRLQTILESIGEILPAQLLSKGKTRVKEIIKSLGKTRENDVTIKLIEKFVKQKSKAEQAVLSLLLARLKKESDRNREEAILNSKVFDNINYFNNEYLKEINNLNIKSFRDIKFLDVNQSLKANGVLILPRFYDRVARLARSAFGSSPERISEELHKTRIKAKPLRYTMEFFRFAYGAEFTNLLKEVKTFVEILGEIHDKDVILSELGDFRVEIKIFNKITPKSKLDTGQIKKLIQKLSSERKDQLREVSRIFKVWIDEDFRKKLIMSLS